MSTEILRRIVLLLGGILLGSILATQVLAHHFAYHASLGQPYRWGIYALYTPLQGVQWVRWWGRWQHRRHFTWAAVAFVGGLVLCMLPLAQGRTQQPVSARWATRRDLRRLRLFGRHGIVLGRFQGRVVRQNEQAHTLVVAPTRRGKTNAVVIPTLLDGWRESLFINDPKTELYKKTANYRRTFSRVHNFQPTSQETAQYNPLDAVRLRTTWDVRDVQLMMDLLLEPDRTEKSLQSESGKHFKGWASDGLTAVTLHGLYTALKDPYAPRFTLAEVDALLTCPWEQLRTEMETSTHPFVRRVAMQMSEIVDRELSSVLSTMRGALRLWTDPLIIRATARSDFALSDLRERLQPMTLYLSIPFGDQDRLRPLSRLLIWQLLDYCTQREDWTGCHKVLGLIDEVPGLHRMPMLSEGLNFLAGYDVTLCLITPSMNELEVIYGHKHNFLDGCKYVLVYSQDDPNVAEQFSRKTCMQEVEKEREMVAREPFAFLREKTTTSRETVQKPLLSMTEIMHLPSDQALLVIGDNYPVILEKTPYYRNRKWLRRSRI